MLLACVDIAHLVNDYVYVYIISNYKYILPLCQLVAVLIVDYYAASYIN